MQNIKKKERLIPTAFNSLHPVNTTDRLMPTAYSLLTFPHLISKELKNSQTNELTNSKLLPQIDKCLRHIRC
jgi:hypothetical protein